MSACVSAQSSPKRSTDSSPSERREVWTASSKRFIAIWRKTVAIWPSIDSASRLSRERASPAASSRRPKTSSSANTEAVSATVSGVSWWKIPRSRARYWWMPWPSSWASVVTSRRRPVQFSIT